MSTAAVLAESPAMADVTVNNLTVSGASHYVGTTYQVSGKGRVGTLLRFVVIHNGTAEYHTLTIQDGQSAASFTWTPADAGTYTFSADVQDGFYTGTEGPLDVTVSAAPPTTPAGTGSASSIPVIGGLLSSLSA
ncbi:hypothetical protein ACWELJ_06755 [Nocardia sp. NPDC004582]